MNNIVTISVKHLNSKFYHFPQGWVEACLEWLFQEHKDEIPSMSNDKWCHLIEQQWLFTDLRDFETPSLSVKISDNFTKFSGIICCQVLSFRVVSKSYYSQIREITGTINENASVTAETDVFNTQTTSSNRSLFLNLTDGVNNFEAFEFEGWNLIENRSIVIGCKCRLKGPFIIRRRIALLKQQNIEILGGEVEDLSSVTQLSILREKLELNTDKRKNLSRNIKSERITKKIQIRNKQSNGTLVNDSLDFKPTGIQKNRVGLKIKKEIENYTPVTENFPKNITPEITNYSSIDSKNNCNPSTEEISQLSLNDWIKNSNALNPLQSNISEGVDDFDEEEEFLLNISLDELTDNGNSNENSIKAENISYAEENSKSENQVSPDKNEPFVYLIDVFNELSQTNVDSIQNKQFKIKGLIFTFSSKLKIVEDDNKFYRWDLQIVLGDGTATVDCFLADEFITRKIGFTAKHFQEMKKSKSVDSYKQSFTEFQSYITKCNCGMFTLQLSDGYDKLCVVDYQTVDEETAKALQSRISQTMK